MTTNNSKAPAGDLATVDTATAVASTGESLTIAGYLDRLKPQLLMALPRGMDADRIARLALTVVRQSETQAQKAGKPEHSLMACSPESFAGSLLTCCALGLEPGVSGEAYLVPYKRECTLIVGYQGLAKLFWQHPLAKHLDAHAVHENDVFDYSYGLAQMLKHKPAQGDRGKITHYYAVAELSTGASSFVVLTTEQVKELRGGKVGPSGDIKDPMHWMERKTALRQLVKLLPKSPTMVAALAVDEQPGTVLHDRKIAVAINQGDSFPELPPSLSAQAADASAAEQAGRVTADELLGDGAAPVTCEVCGPLGPMGHDIDMHFEANVPVPDPEPSDGD